MRVPSNSCAEPKDQANKVLQLDAIQKFIPTLASGKKKEQAAALVVIQDLADSQVAVHLAGLFKGEGSVDYLSQAAASPKTPKAKQAAVEALTTIAANGDVADSKAASRALYDAFDSAKISVVKVTATTRMEP